MPLTPTNSIPVVNGQARTRAHNDSIQISTQDVASELARVLGRQLLGIIVDKGARTVQRWIAGEHSPSTDDEKRLRNSYQVYLLLATVEGDYTIRAWFMGMNPQLQDESPVEALASDKAPEVMAAARAFVAGG